MSQLGELKGITAEFHGVDTWHAAVKTLDRAIDRATMYGLRAVGRTVKNAAKKRVPIYGGPDSRIPPGRLKQSIHTSKRLRKIGPHTYINHVGPWGPVVNLYRGKIEDQSGFMHDGYEAAMGTAIETYRRVYSRTFERFRG